MKERAVVQGVWSYGRLYMFHVPTQGDVGACHASTPLTDGGVRLRVVVVWVRCQHKVSTVPHTPWVLPATYMCMSVGEPLGQGIRGVGHPLSGNSTETTREADPGGADKIPRRIALLRRPEPTQLVRRVNWRFACGNAQRSEHWVCSKGPAALPTASANRPTRPLSLHPL